MACGRQECLHGAIFERNGGLKFGGVRIDDGERDRENVFEGDLLFREVDDRCFSSGKRAMWQVGGRFVTDRQFLRVGPVQRRQRDKFRSGDACVGRDAMFEQIVQIGGPILRNTPIRIHAERADNAGLSWNRKIADADFDGHFRGAAVHGRDGDGAFIEGGGLVVRNAHVQPDGFEGTGGDVERRKIHQRIGPQADVFDLVDRLVRIDVADAA